MTIKEMQNYIKENKYDRNMTIDEAIEYERNGGVVPPTNNIYTYRNKIANWLEELKDLRLFREKEGKNEENYYFTKGYQQGKTDALDALIKMVCEYYTMQERAGCYADANNMIRQRISDFSEQLKAGGKNDT